MTDDKTSGVRVITPDCAYTLASGSFVVQPDGYLHVGSATHGPVAVFAPTAWCAVWYVGTEEGDDVD